MNQTMSITDATPDTGTNRSHSGLGIASFIMGVVTLLAFIAVVVIATGMAMAAGGHLDPKSVQAVMLGLSIVLDGLLSMIGLGLGIACAAQHRHRRILGIIGLCMNALVIVLVLVCFIIGNFKN